jgi:hypothetical protein
LEEEKNKVWGFDIGIQKIKYYNNNNNNNKEKKAIEVDYPTCKTILSK